MIGVRCHIGRGVTIRNSVLMGSDYYQTEQELAADAALGRPPLGIGAGSLIEGAIVDKNCRIGRDVRVINSQGLQDGPETEAGMICDGIVVVSKDAVLPDGFSF